MQSNHKNYSQLVYINLFDFCRHGNGRYEYSALEDDANHQERLEMESKAQRSATRDKANFKCQQYLYNSNRYVFVEQLSDIGMNIKAYQKRQIFIANGRRNNNSSSTENNFFYKFSFLGGVL